MTRSRPRLQTVLYAAGVLLALPPAAYGSGTISHLAGASGAVRDVRRICADDNLYVNHDGTLESAVAWEFGGVQEPYDGAFGEGYDLGPGTVECVTFWISQDGWNQGESSDIYVWDGGVTGAPGAVLALVTGMVFEGIPIWPDFGRYDVEIAAGLTGAATVGSWGNWPWAHPGYWWGVDQNGPPGHPWTHVAEGIGYPAGWQNPDIVWGPGFITSIGIGVHFTAGGSPAESATWGAVKRLFAAAE